MYVLAISGSLRNGSSNTSLLRAAEKLAPFELRLFEGIGALPHFNPDEEDAAPAAVHVYRDALAGAAGVLFSTPEYAHGLPGVLKNALDWVVGTGELVDKPVALVNASPRATFAQAQLTETLTVMSAAVIAEGWVTVQVPRNLDADSIVANPVFADPLREALEAFGRAVMARKAS
jgi:NAD(P)H-dependent FMN reductase